MALRRTRLALVILIACGALLAWYRLSADELRLLEPSPVQVQPTGTPTPTLPRVQHDFPPETPSARERRRVRLHAVKEAMEHSWRGYRARAWRFDEVAPVTGGYRTTLGGWAVTLVDALDTLWLMGLRHEFDEAVDVVAHIDFDTPASLPINVFETTIRHLGGLLAAHDVSQGRYPVLLQKAREVGEMLLPAFQTPSRMPVTRWSKMAVEVAAGHAPIAEIGTLSLEFTRLSQLTGDRRFYEAVARVTDCIESQQDQTKVPGLFPDTVNARECWFGDGVVFSLGGSADSVYEYFPKQHQLLRGATAQYRRLYEKAVGPIKQRLVFRPMTPTDEDLLMVGSVKAFRPDRVEFVPQMQHLACFAGGMLALGARLFDAPDDLDVARRLVRGCIWASNQTALKVLPESFHLVPCPDPAARCPWDEDVWGQSMVQLNSHDETAADKLLPAEERRRRKAERLRLPAGMSAMANRRYELRPEVVESLFVLYRVTGDEAWRDAAWTLFTAITESTRTTWGFSAIDDVTSPRTMKLDRMESYWMAETLKYFWLLFEEPTVVSLDDFVFNTEAHPFRLAPTPT